MLRQHVMNPLWTATPAWFALDPKAPEESAQPSKDFIYHRPVLQKEVFELLKPKAGSLILDGTCGGGGHTEALLESGADVLALDQDPDAVRHVAERLAHVGRRGRQHPATQVFQALRMEVNDELGALRQGLRVLTARLEGAGRIAVITFHSLEDRMVKTFFRDHSKEWLDRPEWSEPRCNPDYDLALVTPKHLERSEEEQRANPRSRSATLRVAG